ncbi:hypothetical protein [Flavobacterium ovatum]|uniref:hypothetical protein n=1 Tax=Flavobacterium ovatum TaxID=1928857 RepID=UPI00344D6191
MFKLGQNVQEESGVQIMKVIDLEPGLEEIVVTQWKDELGNTLIGEFSESQLTIADGENVAQGS